jgi:hypothetical protein
MPSSMASGPSSERALIPERALPSRWSLRLPISADTIQDCSNILLECCRVWAGKAKIDQKDLVLLSQAVKRSLVWMGLQELPDTFLGYPSALRRKPAIFLPASNLTRSHLKQIRETINSEYRETMNFMHFVMEASDLRADGFHAVTSTSGDRRDCCVGT